MKAPVLNFTRPIGLEQEPLAEAQRTMESALGRVVPLIDVTLLSVNAGLGVVGAAGAGSLLPAGYTILDLEDAFCDQARLVVYGTNSTSTLRTVLVRDATNAVDLVSVEIDDSAVVRKSDWAAVTPFSGDRVLELRVVGDGAETQTIYSVHLQLRTIQFQP